MTRPVRKYELIGHEGGRPPILVVFRHPWSLYVRTKRFRLTLGRLFRIKGLWRVTRVTQRKDSAT